MFAGFPQGTTFLTRQIAECRALPLAKRAVPKVSSAPHFNTEAGFYRSVVLV
jgi:hypothetical protein